MRSDALTAQRHIRSNSKKEKASLTNSIANLSAWEFNLDSKAWFVWWNMRTSMTDIPMLSRVK
jgi:hypothetical protein